MLVQHISSGAGVGSMIQKLKVELEAGKEDPPNLLCSRGGLGFSTEI